MPRKIVHPRYSIVRKLGSGGSGAVYLAEDLLDNKRQVALKVCHRDHDTRETQREFRILRELRHSGIAQALDFGKIAGRSQNYFTMEYVEGESFDEIEKKSLLQWRPQLGQGVDLFLQIAEVLDYVHRRDLLHLDIKPSNIIVSEGRVKLIDFGIFENALLNEPSRPSRGTAYFAAPEVFGAGSLDARSDLYSLGATIYKVYTGEYPISGRSIDEIAYNHRYTVPKESRVLPESISRIVMKLLAKSPEHRFQSAAELVHALRELCPEVAAERGAPRIEPDFVGRLKPLKAFFSWADAVSSGGPSTFVIRGGAGIGKTRFAETCATELSGSGYQVIRLPGSCGKESLRNVVEKVALLSRNDPSGRSEYKALVQALANEESDQVLEQARQFITNQAAGRSFVLLIDDLHLAHDELRGFVKHVSRCEEHLGSFGIVVTCCSRSPVSRELRRAETVDVTLEPLSRAESLKALEAYASLLGPEQRSAMAKESHGIPGSLFEIVQSALDGRARDDHDQPSTRFDDVEQRLQGLSSAQGELLLFVALLKRSTSETTLRKLLGQNRATFRAAREALLELGLIRVRQDGCVLGEGTEEVVLKFYDAETQQTAHRLIGRHFAKDTRTLDRAADHLFRSDQPDEALGAAINAADGCRAAGKIDEAIELYGKALEYELPSSERSRVLEEVGDLQARSGRFAAAEESYRALLESSSGTRGRLSLMRRIAGVQHKAGRSMEAKRTLTDALHVLDEVDDLDENLHVLHYLADLHMFPIGVRACHFVRQPRVGVAPRSACRQTF